MNNRITIIICVLSVICIMAMETIQFYNNVNSCKFASEILHEKVFAVNGFTNGTDYYIYYKGRHLNETKVHEECHIMVNERREHFCGSNDE